MCCSSRRRFIVLFAIYKLTILVFQQKQSGHGIYTGQLFVGCVTSGEATGGLGLGGLNPPPLSSGATHEICTEPMRKYWGTPPPRNVVPANTLVLVAHLVTFSESQLNQFYPRAKKPTAPWGSPWPPSAALPLDPAGDSAAHSSPCTFSLTPPAELRQNKQPKWSPHHYICYKSLHLQQM